MFSKTAFVCVLAVCLVQVSEGIFGIDTAVEAVVATVATSVNAQVQNYAGVAVSTLSGLQGTLVGALADLSPNISAAVDSAIASAVTQAGGSQAKITNCTAQHKTELMALTTNTITTVRDTCLNLDVSQAIQLVAAVSSLSNNLTQTLVGVNSAVTSACGTAASGDLLGGVFNTVCTVGVLGVITGEVSFQALGFSTIVTQAQSIVQSITTDTLNIGYCVQAQLGSLATSAETVLAPIVACTLTV